MKKEELLQKTLQLAIGLYYFNENTQIPPPTNLITLQFFQVRNNNMLLLSIQYQSHFKDLDETLLMV